MIGETVQILWCGKLYCSFKQWNNLVSHFSHFYSLQRNLFCVHTRQFFLSHHEKREHGKHLKSIQRILGGNQNNQRDISFVWISCFSNKNLYKGLWFCIVPFSSVARKSYKRPWKYSFKSTKTLKDDKWEIMQNVMTFFTTHILKNYSNTIGYKKFIT